MITIQERVTRAMHQLALIGAAARDGASNEYNIIPKDVMDGIVFAAEQAHEELYWISRNGGRGLQSVAPDDDDLIAAGQQTSWSDTKTALDK